MGSGANIIGRPPWVPCGPMAEIRRIEVDGAPLIVQLDGDQLVSGDGMRFDVDSAHHLPPVEPTKVLAVHLNYRSRVDEFMTRLPPAPTYFQKPTTALNAHRGDVVRPPRCRFLNFEGEIAIVIGQECRNVASGGCPRFRRRVHHRQ